MKILVCNVGSTSLKYRLFDLTNGEETLSEGHMERVGTQAGAWQHKDAGGEATKQTLPIPDYATGIRLMQEALLQRALPSMEALDCVAFKVVHAKGVTGVQLLDETVLSAMAAFNTVAPSHNPPYISAIRQFQEALPNTPMIGSFETGFHASMPPKAYLYSVPIALHKDHAIRRYGFHGASHEYVSTRTAELMGRTDFKLISCHLGGSGSLCAIVNGKSIDTNLGFSLQCGIMHNNRCGDIDPYIPIYLMKDFGYTLEQIETMLNKQSGLLGMSGVSNDLRDVEIAAEQGNEDAQNAVDSYCYQIQKQIGSYAAAMGGVDAISFAGGIGENSALVRKKALEGLEFMGISLDQNKNETAKPDCELTGNGSRVRTFAIATNEEIVVARKAKSYLLTHAK
ncbi:MAG: acetate/propionate family kinase [Christensenella sp.]|nr:acetate/propionate family kinase [Christensenella sp.]